MRIAVGAISHETNTFSTVLTDLESFRQRGLYRGEDIFDNFAGTNTEVGGFLQGAETHGLDLIPTVCASAMPGGIVTSRAFRCLLDELVERIQRAGSIDGVLLALHGAMVTETHDDGEGAVLRAVREVVGQAPVVATLDLHSNTTPLMVDSADILIGYDEYPHTDMAARGAEAAHLIAALGRREIHPTPALRKLPMIPTSQRMMTADPPMADIMQMAHEVEQDPIVLNVTVSGGFPLADIAEAGFGVLVTTDANRDMALGGASQIASFAWEQRHKFLGGTLPVEEAVARAVDASQGPIVLVDVADNPATGGPGDGTSLLRELVARGVEDAAFAVIADPEAVHQLVAAGLGATVTLRVGGKVEKLYGEPVQVSGEVKNISDGEYRQDGPMMTGVLRHMGKAVVLDCAGLELIICELKQSPTSLQVFRSQGIEPTEKKILAIKGKGHFRAAFGPIAKSILLAEGKGTCGSERCIRRLSYKKVHRPIFPLDDI